MTLNKHLKSRLERIDWDFAGAASESPFSALHWHPARLPSQVAAACIGLLSDPGDLILDPFLGSGTTVVEAQRLRRQSIGFDLNPVACLISRAKTLNLSAGRIAVAVNELQRQASEILDGPVLGSTGPLSHLEPPPGVQRKWYTPRVLRDLTILWSTVSALRGPKKTLALMAFSGSLLPVCRETRHWGYVCDNSTPLTDHEGSVLENYHHLLERLCLAYGRRDEDLGGGDGPDLFPAQIVCADSRDALSKVKPASVRLVVSSPPYFGVSDYVKSQRLTMEWLSSEIEPVRLKEIGARSKRHRKTAFEEYLGDLNIIFTRILPALTRNGMCIAVLGESSRRAAYVADFQRGLKKSGFDIIHTATRNISQQRRQYASIETESITVAVPR